MKKILVSLVSEQTIPNILLAAHYRPDDFWFVSTERMEKEGKVECIENTLNESVFSRALDYGIEILLFEQVKNLKGLLKERYGF